MKEAKSELKKVIWPSRKEIISSTILVLVTVLFFALLIGSLDFLFAQLIKLISLKLL
ncbi:MAG: preprotein translocase subunit SecE [Actinomycetota bacterium]